MGWTPEQIAELLELLQEEEHHAALMLLRAAWNRAGLDSGALSGSVDLLHALYSDDANEAISAAAGSSMLPPRSLLWASALAWFALLVFMVVCDETSYVPPHVGARAAKPQRRRGHRRQHQDQRPGAGARGCGTRALPGGQALRERVHPAPAA